MRKITVRAIVAMMMVGSSFLMSSAHALHDSINTALVYRGEGSCDEKCSSSAAKIALFAGLIPKYVSPETIPENASSAEIKALFKKARVWIQPGGYAREAHEAMSTKFTAALKEFILNGGGYVGFCAGAFMATREIGTTGAEGLGIFPGSSAPYAHPDLPGVTFSLPNVTWLGKKRAMYFEGGPYLYGYESSATQKVETIAKYDDDGLTAAARTEYGKGRVFITGVHPEAPKQWTESDHVHDPDGTEHAYAIDMVKWAAKKK